MIWEKYTNNFYEYIKGEKYNKGEVIHSPVGAIFSFERWYNGDNINRNCTAQIISMVIFAHHSGFMDIHNTTENSPFHEALSMDKSKLCYDEAVNNYLNNMYDTETLDSDFDEAVNEFKAVRKS